MSDDLVKRLRNTGSMSHAQVWETFEDAADRIEELTAERDEALNQLDRARHSVAVLEKRVKTFSEGWGVSDKGRIEAETNLEKAVEALSQIATDEHPLGWIAIAALTELKGEDRG